MVLQRETKQHIPTDILFSILVRLPAASLQKLKYVSKQWFETIRDPYFTESHLAHQPEDEFCLIYNLGSDTAFLGSRISTAGNFFKRNIPSYDAMIHDSRNGLILFGDGSLRIVNPVSGDILTLPPFSDNNILASACIVCDPWRVVVLKSKRHDRTHLLTCFVLTLGSSSWKEVHSPFSGFPSGLVTKPVFARGSLYWFYQTDILSLDLSQEKFQRIFITYRSSQRYSPIFLEWDGCPAIVPKCHWAKSYCVCILRGSGWTNLQVDISFFNRFFASKGFYEEFLPYPIASIRHGRVIIFKIWDRFEFLAYNLGTGVMTPLEMQLIHGRSVNYFEIGGGFFGSIISHVNSMVSCFP